MNLRSAPSSGRNSLGISHDRIGVGSDEMSVAGKVKRRLDKKKAGPREGRLKDRVTQSTVLFASAIDAEEMSSAPAAYRISLARSTSSPSTAWTDMRMLPSLTRFS